MPDTDQSWTERLAADIDLFSEAASRLPDHGKFELSLRLGMVVRELKAALGADMGKDRMLAELEARQAARRERAMRAAACKRGAKA